MITVTGTGAVVVVVVGAAVVVVGPTPVVGGVEVVGGGAVVVVAWVVVVIGVPSGSVKVGMAFWGRSPMSLLVSSLLVSEKER